MEDALTIQALTGNAVREALRAILPGTQPVRSDAIGSATLSVKVSEWEVRVTLTTTGVAPTDKPGQANVKFIHSWGSIPTVVFQSEVFGMEELMGELKRVRSVLLGVLVSITTATEPHKEAKADLLGDLSD